MQVRGTRPGRDPVPRGRAVVGVGLGGACRGVGGRAVEGSWSSSLTWAGWKERSATRWG